ncbi:hypothetical protein [Streptomyces sp. Tu102]|uniref:hypothetical protein n=1 Tax=Streptomyces TaxID=1883 RepID=UPI001BDD9E44|nr:hypothetical protein [Streptomyces sp. Tu102]MBT1098367.1 hypothetical protein [Streptomyces sp. Tu102]
MEDVALWSVAATLATRALDAMAGEFGRTAWMRLSRLLRLREPDDFGVTEAVEEAWSEEATGASVERIRRRLIDRAAADPQFAADLGTWWSEVAREVQDQLPPRTEIRAEIHSGGHVGTLIQANQVDGGISIAPPPPVSHDQS